MKPLLTPADLAELAQVPLGTVYQWSYKGTGPASLKLGRHLRFRREDVEAWLQEREIPADRLAPG